MTQIEQRMYSLIVAACRQYLDDSNPDAKWEQRRYEIARDLYAHNRDASAARCVAWADELIKELKKVGKEV